MSVEDQVAEKTSHEIPVVILHPQHEHGVALAEK